MGQVHWCVQTLHNCKNKNVLISVALMNWLLNFIAYLKSKNKEKFMSTSLLTFYVLIWPFIASLVLFVLCYGLYKDIQEAKTTGNELV